MTDTILPIVNKSPLLARQSRIPTYKGDESTDPHGFLCFTLDGQEYGVDLNLVAQIVKPPSLTWVPRMEPHILGIISIRGSVVTLIDLRQLMGLEPTPWPKTSRVLTVVLDNEHIGLLVDSVTQVRRIKVADLEKNPSLSEGQNADYVLFIARPQQDKQVVVIDLDAILREKFG
jgi:purine-binding chemotaxis protein CheW